MHVLSCRQNTRRFNMLLKAFTTYHNFTLENAASFNASSNESAFKNIGNKQKAKLNSHILIPVQQKPTQFEENNNENILPSAILSKTCRVMHAGKYYTPLRNYGYFQMRALTIQKFVFQQDIGTYTTTICVHP